MSTNSHQACSDFRNSVFYKGAFSRRSLLTSGMLGLGGLSLTALLQAEEENAANVKKIAAKAKRCIMLFQFGGPSQFETFDPKPGAPAEIRGEFKTIATKNPELRFCEYLPRLAKMSDQFALVRTVHHDRSSHNPGAYYSLTGRRPLNPNVTANATSTDFPCPGAVIDHFQRGKEKIPTAVSLPTMIADGPFRTPGEFAGFLGKEHDPLFITQDPNSKNFSVDQLSLPGGVAVQRLRKRKKILDTLSKSSKLQQKNANMQGMNAYQQRAFDLLTSPKTEQALAISKESTKTRDRYGRNQYGQSVLLARRLIEAGVRFVTVYYSAGISGWDTHKQNFKTLKGSRLPQTDLAVSALIEDLQQRNLLDETLILWTGDFGRTPKINKDAGRDHWPACQTVMLTGGGIKLGAVVGTSDKTGAYPLDTSYKPDDIMATMYHQLGINPKTIIHDQLKRPMPIADGKVIKKLL